MNANSKLFVGGLPAETTHADLVRLFATAGPVFGVKIVMDRQTKRSKGFAFVEMATPADAQAALKKLDGHKLVDRRIFITEARPQIKRVEDLELPKQAAKPAPGFVERRSGKDRRAQPAEEARRKPEPAAPAKKPAPNPGGFGPGFHPNKWKKPNRARR